MTLDFTFFLEPPVLTHEAVLTVEALAPLSMVAAQPGSYFRSQPAPTNQMLYGMLENALGWHLENQRKAEPLDRKRLIQALRKKIPRETKKSDAWRESLWLTEQPPRSSNAFFSLLRYHLRFTLRHVPEVTHYDDLWTRLARRGDDFIGGSRNYDHRLEPLIGMLRQKKAKLSSKGSAKIRNADDIPAQFEPGVTVYQGALKSAFPEYYYSPTPREYVCPKGVYRFRVQTTPTLANLLRGSVAAPASPLYLGSNDGWVEAHWEDLP
jgi:CRISPR-associated protein Cas5